MRPSSLGGAALCVALCLSVCLSVCPSVPLSLPNVTSRHLANYNDTHVLFGTRRGPHIVRPSRPHKFLFNYIPSVSKACRSWGNLLRTEQMRHQCFTSINEFGNTVFLCCMHFGAHCIHASLYHYHYQYQYHFIARQHAMYADRDIVYCPSVCLSNASAVSKRMDISRFFEMSL